MKHIWIQGRTHSLPLCFRQAAFLKHCTMNAWLHESSLTIAERGLHWMALYSTKQSKPGKHVAVGIFKWLSPRRYVRKLFHVPHLALQITLLLTQFEKRFKDSVDIIDTKKKLTLRISLKERELRLSISSWKSQFCNNAEIPTKTNILAEKYSRSQCLSINGWALPDPRFNGSEELDRQQRKDAPTTGKQFPHGQRLRPQWI